MTATPAIEMQGVWFSLFGLWLSYVFDLTSGATIIRVAGVGFFLFQMVDFLKHKVKIRGARTP
jgi:ABC-type Mn2+/Zn2+ transport system permease subunit